MLLCIILTYVFQEVVIAVNFFLSGTLDVIRYTVRNVYSAYNLVLLYK